MMDAAKVLDEREPQLAVLLKLSSFGGVEDVLQVAGDHGGGYD